VSKGKCFTNKYKFSHEEIKVFPKYKKLTKKKKVLPTNRNLAMKRWEFCQEV
jgi:hypothetical protein